jgi:TRAP-type C4-dicarboxylate transport system permease small subunit
MRISSPGRRPFSFRDIKNSLNTPIDEMSSPVQNRNVNVVNAFLVVLLVLILGVVLGSVFCRYVLNQSLTWSDEVVRYLFVWFVLIGSAAVLRDRMHIRVEFFVDLLPANARRLLEMSMLVLIIAFNAVLTLFGLLWVLQTQGTFTPALGMPLNWVFYGALPVTALLSVWFGVRRFCAGQYAEQANNTDESATS